MSPQIRSLGVFVKKQPILVVCAVISLVLVAVLVLRFGALDDKTQERNDRHDEDLKMSKNVEFSAKLPAQLLALQNANKEVMARAVHPKELSLNLQYFYRIEHEAGVTDQGVRHVGMTKVDKKAPKTVYVPDAYTVTVTGDFRQVVDLLRHIEQGSHFSRELNAAVAPLNKEDPTSTKLTLVLNLELLAVPSS